MKNLEDFFTPQKPWEVEGVKWREVRLGDFLEIVYRYPNFYGFTYVDNGVPILRGELIKDKGEVENDLEKYKKIPLEISQKYPKTILRRGDLVITVRGTLGKIAYITPEQEEWQISPNLIRISPMTHKLESKFLFWFLTYLFNFYRDFSAVIPRLKASTIKNLKIPLPFRNGKPDLETQKKIVEYIEANFSRIDRILEKKKEALKQLNELWESVLEQAFKPKDGEEWREMRLREVTKDVKSGFALSKQKRRKINVNNGFPQLRPYNIANWNKINFDELTYIPKSMAGIEEYFIKNDDVLFNNTNSIELVGRAAVYRGLNRNYTYSNHITRIRVKKQIITSDFFSWYLNYLWNKGFFYLKATKWIGQAGISNKKFLSTKIPLPFRNSKPDIEKQKEIANYLDNIYEKIKTLKEKNQNQIAQLEKMKESILDEVFNHENK